MQKEEKKIWGGKSSPKSQAFESGEASDRTLLWMMTLLEETLPADLISCELQSEDEGDETTYTLAVTVRHGSKHAEKMIVELDDALSLNTRQRIELMRMREKYARQR